MNTAVVTPTRILRTPELRLDPHHFTLSSHVEKLLEDASGLSLSRPTVKLRNGINLQAASYEQNEETTGYLYASVGAISQFALRTSHCTVLKSPDIGGYQLDAGTSAQANELWITRSGTPGIAWPAQLAPGEETLYPSGFLIRVTPKSGELLPGYVAAILNHPLWRVWSASLAAGKRQRNLSQDHLAQIRVPGVSLATQQAVEDAYLSALDEVALILGTDIDVLATADDVLQSVIGSDYATVVPTKLTVDTVPLSAALWRSRTVRLDPNFHRSDLRAVAAQVQTMQATRLEELLVDEVIKSAQPKILDEDLGEDPRIVASISLQAGNVQRELTKPTSDEQFARAKEKAVRPGDILLAMDGYSAGKAAIFDRDFSAVTDSHVAILRMTDADTARSLVCFIASSLCQAQIKLALSGSSAYQLAKPDVKSLAIPKVVLDRASEIGDRFFNAMEGYESLVQRVRQKIAEAAVDTGQILLGDAALGDGVAEALRACSSAERTSEILALLQPDMF